MTCPVNHQQSPVQATTMAAVRSDTRGEAVVDRFEQVAGSVFVGLFAAALFDQAMLPAVSAALEDTGRIRNAPWGRALRTAASDQLIFAGDEVDRLAESERLLRLHREVKGVSANGVRYSALHPESWNWIMISTFFMYRGAYLTLTGEKLSATDNQAIWDHVRVKIDALQLPGQSRLIVDYDELCAHYDRIVAEKLEPTSTLHVATEITLRPPRPDLVPTVAGPLWKLTAPAAGHVVAVLGFGIMDPQVRAIVPMPWTRRHDTEFTILTTLLRLAYQWLPTRVTDTPLARNRRQYRRLVTRYRDAGLASFAR